MSVIHASEPEQRQECSHCPRHCPTPSVNPRLAAILEATYPHVLAVCLALRCVVKTQEMEKIGWWAWEYRRRLGPNPPCNEEDWGYKRRPLLLQLLEHITRLIKEVEEQLMLNNGPELKSLVKPVKTLDDTHQRYMIRLYKEAVEWAKENSTEEDEKTLGYITPSSHGILKSGEYRRFSSLVDTMGLEFIVNAVARFILELDIFVESCPNAPEVIQSWDHHTGLPKPEKPSLIHRLFSSKEPDPGEEVVLVPALELGDVTKWAKYWGKYLASEDFAAATRHSMYYDSRLGEARRCQSSGGRRCSSCEKVVACERVNLELDKAHGNKALE